VQIPRLDQEGRDVTGDFEPLRDTKVAEHGKRIDELAEQLVFCGILIPQLHHAMKPIRTTRTASAVRAL
jgi:hypothetical protein